MWTVLLRSMIALQTVILSTSMVSKNCSHCWAVCSASCLELLDIVQFGLWGRRSHSAFQATQEGCSEGRKLFWEALCCRSIDLFVFFFLLVPPSSSLHYAVAQRDTCLQLGQMEQYAFGCGMLALLKSSWSLFYLLLFLCMWLRMIYKCCRKVLSLVVSLSLP